MHAENNRHQLIEVKEAAANYDWSKCDELTEKLASSLSVEDALNVGVHEIEFCLAAFERRHSDIRWPRTLVSLIQQRDTAAYSLDFLPWTEGTNPIDSSLLNALEMLRNAAEDHDKPEACTWEVWRAVCWSIFARRLEYYAGEFPEDWEVSLLSASGKTNLPPIKSRYLAEPKIEEFTATLWLGFVREIESQLKV